VSMRTLVKRLQAGPMAERGQALVEFTIVVLVFMLFLFGILDAARLFQSWSAVQHSAREGARYGITGRTTCVFNGVTYSTRADCIVKSSKDATTGMLGGGVTGPSGTVRVYCQSFEYNNAYAAQGNTTENCTGTSAGDQCDAEEVKVTYNHKFITPLLQFAAPSGIDLVGRQRMINEPFGPC
jgi:Flp pilus assembly protein TadG